jgi:predicted Zn-ribbon and HTH transcriptional regulator
MLNREAIALLQQQDPDNELMVNAYDSDGDMAILHVVQIGNQVGRTVLQLEEETLYRIQYICPNCGHEWEEEYSCACDSECPNCECQNIQASSYEEVK